MGLRETHRIAGPARHRRSSISDTSRPGPDSAREGGNLAEDPRISKERARLAARAGPLLLAVHNRSLEAAGCGEVARTVIYTSGRSGSTFLSTLLNSHPGSFFFHEPLAHWCPFGIRRSAEKTARAIEIVRKVLTCRYQDIPEEFYETRRRKLEHELAMNKQLGRICAGSQKSALDCFTPRFLSSLSSIHPIQVVKEVRLPLSSAEELLKDPSLNVRVIFLVRDPRGVMQSRKHVPWCRIMDDSNSTGVPFGSAVPGAVQGCFTTRYMCEYIERDYLAARRLVKLYPGRIWVQRYEDLMTDLEHSVPALFQFAGLSLTDETREFLRSHTVAKPESIENVGALNEKFRYANLAKDSKKNAFKWVRLLSYQEIEEFQKYCLKAMDAFGYKPIYKNEFTGNISIDQVFQEKYRFS